MKQPVANAYKYFFDTNLEHNNQYDERKRYPFSFTKPNGIMGDLCYYLNYGIDTYRSGCYHDCLYCFARAINKSHNEDRWNINDVSIINTKSIAKQFKNAFETDKAPTKITSILRQRIPIKIGRNSDPFHPIEKDIQATYETLEIFKHYKYPYILCTKSDMVADDKYMELYSPEITYVQITVTTLNEVLAKRIEPNACPPFKRIEAGKKISDLGIKTAFRIQPLFPIFPDGTLSGNFQNRESLKSKYFSFDLVDELIKLKPHCIIAGFLKVYDMKIYREFSGAGMDLVPFYRMNRKYFSVQEIREYYSRIKTKCDDTGVKFSVCFDKADNFEQFKYLWANKNDCCCAKNMIGGFTKTARDVFCT